MMYGNFVKPIADRFVAASALVIASPLVVLVTVFLTIANNGKPFFIQPRPGKNNRIFRLIKFRSMTDEKDAQGMLLPDEQRLTGIGKFVRKTSIDELPQLINVLKGEMSFVGPRPLLIEYIDRYNARQSRRHEVLPGITGWAQVNGRNSLSWKDKLEMDVFYVENRSFIFDLRILLITVIKVFKGEGINSSQSATMEKFAGTPADKSDR